jgi:hypothetical protein
MVESGRIRDAKTVTVTGAAIFEDILNRNTTGFSLQKDESAEALPDTTIWGVYRRVGRIGHLDSENRLDPGSQAAVLDIPALTLPTVFGRKLTSLSTAEPVYRLDYVNPSGESAKLRDAVVSLRLRRVNLPGGIGDALEIEPGSVRRVSGPEFDPANVQLRLRTMTEEAFWMDQPRFEVDFCLIGVG